MRAGAFSSLFALTSLVDALGTNRTIDDNVGDSVTGAKPVYDGTWDFGPECKNCRLKPKQSKAFEGTWHHATYDAQHSAQAPNVTLTFNGTAIYIFCIIPNGQKANLTTATSMNFTLDGALAGAFTHAPAKANAQNFLYNTPVFSREALADGNHTLTVAPQLGSYIAFDYAVYTSLDTSTASAPAFDPDSTNSSPPVAAIAGGVVGAVVLVLLALGVFLLRRRRKRRAAAQPFAMRMSAQSLLAPVSSGSVHKPRAPVSAPQRSGSVHKPALDVPIIPPATRSETSSIVAETGSVPPPPPPPPGLTPPRPRARKKGAPNPGGSQRDDGGQRDAEGGSETVLRHEVAELREEMERMRAELAPPPAYQDEVRTDH